jgi:flagellar protein FliJ
MLKPRWLERARDACARREQRLALALAECRRQLREGEAKLSELEQYRSQYRRDFDQRATAGISAERARGFQTFLVRLDQALSEQRELLTHARAQEAEELRKWRGAARRNEALERLLERRRAAARRQETRVEQAASDAHAQRLWAIKGARRGH